MRNDLLEREVTFLRALQKMGEEMDRVWKGFFEKNSEMKDEDVWQWVEKRLRS